MLAASVVLALHAHGQGSIMFNNVFPITAPVTISAVPGTFNPTDGPAGAYVGSNYTASLFFVNGTVTNQTVFDSLNPTWVANAVFFGGDGAGFFDGGQVRLFAGAMLLVVFRGRR